MTGTIKTLSPQLGGGGRVRGASPILAALPPHPSPLRLGRGRVSAPRVGAARMISCIAVLSLLVLTLAGCGRKGTPQPPPGVPKTYPRIYPNA